MLKSFPVAFATAACVTKLPPDACSGILSAVFFEVGYWTSSLFLWFAGVQGST